MKIPVEVQSFLANQTSEMTVKCYRSELLNMIKSIGRRLKKIRPTDLITYRSTFQSNKNSTAHRKICIIRSFFKFLQDAGFRKDNPALVLKLPRFPKVSPYKILNSEELSALVKQPDLIKDVGIRDHAILMLLAINGLRGSELVNINIEDLSEVDGHKVVRIIGKGSKVRRSKLVGSVEKALSRWLSIRNSNTGPLFASSLHPANRICTETLRYIVKKYAKQAGIKKRVTPHALRHAAISHALANGANILKVKEMAGHSSLNTTQGYLHDLETISDNAVDYNPLNKEVV